MINQGTICTSGLGHSMPISGSSLVNNGLIAALDGGIIRQLTALTNNAMIQIAPTSRWQIYPSYTLTMTPTGRIEAQAASDVGGVSAGRVVVAGTLSAGGTLAVTDAPGHPGVCSIATPIAATQGAGQIVGAFAQLVVPPVPTMSTGSIIVAGGV